MGISFANNGIRTLEGFNQISHQLPELNSLSLELNSISTLSELDFLKGYKLHELSLVNNPIPEQHDPQRRDVYELEVAKRLPELKYLDGQKLKPAMQFLPSFVMNSMAQLPPVRGNFYDSTNTKQVVEAFLQSFFALYDSNRENLLEIYLEPSLFSLSSGLQCQSCPQIFKICCSLKKNFFFFFLYLVSKGTADDQINNYRKISRNFLFTKEDTRRHQTISRGRVNIIYLLGQLPKTRHNLADLRVDAFFLGDNADKMMGVSDSRTPLLNVTVAGSFWEGSGGLGGGVNRSFSRNFLLVPAAPNSA